MRIVRIVAAATAACGTAATLTTAGPVAADVGPVCSSNPTGVEAQGRTALRSEPLKTPTIVPGRMMVTAVANPWRTDTDWHAALSWRNTNTGLRGTASTSPTPVGRAVFNHVPTGSGTVVFTVRVNRIGINPPVLECHGVARIA
ncbi:hypothetical protein [Tsukamurella sp. 1534]|uniref:hypothetical protein n=1 Tax=Tsukamurella sp. 1534 TaxID=1151061 RepID=UPI0002DCE5C7|nr:hypothetical protein [Tsukamurella sp. 1534]